MVLARSAWIRSLSLSSAARLEDWSTDTLPQGTSRTRTAWSWDKYQTIIITGCATPASPVICPQRTGRCRKPVSQALRVGTPSRSRDAICVQALHLIVPLLKRGRRECRVRAAPAVSCAKLCIWAHTSIQVSGNTPTSPAQWLYGLLRALPGGAGLLSPSSAGYLP